MPQCSQSRRNSGQGNAHYRRKRAGAELGVRIQLGPLFRNFCEKGRASEIFRVGFGSQGLSRCLKPSATGITKKERYKGLGQMGGFRADRGVRVCYIQDGEHSSGRSIAACLTMLNLAFLLVGSDTCPWGLVEPQN